MASAQPLSLEERRRRRDARRNGQDPDQVAAPDVPLLEDSEAGAGRPKFQLQLNPIYFQIAAFLAVGAADLAFVLTRIHPAHRVLATGLWSGLLLAVVIAQAVIGEIGNRRRFLAAGLFIVLPFIVLPIFFVVRPSGQWLALALSLVGAVALTAGLRLAFSQASALWQARSGSDADQEPFPGLQIEWATLVFLLALAVGAGLAAWLRKASIPVFATGVWTGLWLGLLGVHAIIRRREARSMLFAGIFAGLPLVGVPVYRFVWPDRAWLSWAGALLAGTALAAALRLAFQLRVVTEGQEPDASQETPPAEQQLSPWSRANQVLSAWFHDALLKWAAGFILGTAGIVAIVVGHQRPAEQPVWIGLLLLCAIGSVGRWTPGLYQRTPWLKALRASGAIAFWLSLLLVPFLEVKPSGQIPLAMWPSVRFIGLGLGLALVGATWFLQEHTLVSRSTNPEPKQSIETPISLVLVVLGLATTFVGLQIRQRDMVRVDSRAVTQTNVAGTSHFGPVDQIKALRIVQPYGPLPVYTNYLDFADGSSYRVDSQVYPAQDAFVTAVRSAAGLNSQSFPEAGVEQWTR